LPFTTFYPAERSEWNPVAAPWRGGQGAEMKSGYWPYKPDWQTALIRSRAAPRCRARCRKSKLLLPSTGYEGPSAGYMVERSGDRRASATAPIGRVATPPRQRWKSRRPVRSFGSFGGWLRRST